MAQQLLVAAHFINTTIAQHYNSVSLREERYAICHEKSSLQQRQGKTKIFRQNNTFLGYEWVF